jgi:hypothetical protein
MDFSVSAGTVGAAPVSVGPMTAPAAIVIPSEPAAAIRRGESRSMVVLSKVRDGLGRARPDRPPPAAAAKRLAGPGYGTRTRSGLQESRASVLADERSGSRRATARGDRPRKLSRVTDTDGRDLLAPATRAPEPARDPAPLRRAAFLVLLVALTTLPSIATRELMPSDEPRFALVARQMVEDPAPVVPHLGLRRALARRRALRRQASGLLLARLASFRS